MRKLILLFLTLSLALAPVAGTFAGMFGSDGEHMHFDHVWHSVELNSGAAHDWHDDHDGPITHSHADHVHHAFYLASHLSPLVHPTGPFELTAPPEVFFSGQHPHPPFRPPQAA